MATSLPFVKSGNTASRAVITKTAWLVAAYIAS